jgi:hypothetical protein
VKNGSGTWRRHAPLPAEPPPDRFRSSNFCVTATAKFYLPLSGKKAWAFLLIQSYKGKERELGERQSPSDEMLLTVVVWALIQEGRFSRAGFPDEVHMRSPVHALNAEHLPLVAKVCLGKEGQGILSVRDHVSILLQSEKLPKAADVSAAGKLLLQRI